MTWDPREITRFTEDLQGVGGEIKADPESFRVEELPLYDTSGEGEHVYLFVEKRDVSAKHLVDRIASKFGVSNRTIGVAGMKDRRAVTRQWISVHDHDLDPEDAVGPIGDDIRVLEATRHKNKLRTGHLLGNRFALEIRDVEVDIDTAQKRAGAILERLQARGVPNYFGKQRFGRDLSTLELGLALVRGERPPPLRKNKWLRRLAASAAQSALFNWVLNERLKAGTALTVLLGDRLNRTTERGQLLVTAENIDEARAGVERDELIPTGPLFGAKMYDVADEALALEETALAAFDLTREQFDAISRVAPGTRRDLFVRFLEPPSVASTDDGSLEIGFSLPSGTYATIVLAELTTLDYSAWEAP